MGHDGVFLGTLAQRCGARNQLAESTDTQQAHRRIDRLIEIAIGTIHGVLINESLNRNWTGNRPVELLSLFHPRLAYTHVRGHLALRVGVGVNKGKKRECVVFYYLFLQTSFSLLSRSFTLLHPTRPSSFTLHRFLHPLDSPSLALSFDKRAAVGRRSQR